MTIAKQRKAYLFPVFLLISIVAGGIAGHVVGTPIKVIKPLGDIFLNLIFTIVVPLVFFSVAASISSMGKSNQWMKMTVSLLGSFIFTGVFAAIFMLAVVKVFPPAQDTLIQLTALPQSFLPTEKINLANIVTVSEFGKLLSHENMLALIIISLLVGLATAASGEKGKHFSAFLQSGAEVSMRVITYIMYYAPIGFFAYFAVMMADFGPKLLHNYLHVASIYYLSATVYFILGFSIYVYLAGKTAALKQFWQNISYPMLTALGTCSSAASIPANLQAAQKMGIPAEIYETGIPLGAILHKDGSVLGGVVKIAFLFGIFHLPLAGIPIMASVILVSLLVGTVMGAIPSGGMLGEVLILSVYGFPAEALVIIAAISIIIDPLATMLNVTGDAICCMLVARFVDQKEI